MGLRPPFAERRGAEESLGRGRDKVMARAATHLGARSTCYTRVQRAASANSRTAS